MGALPKTAGNVRFAPERAGMVLTLIAARTRMSDANWRAVVAFLIASQVA